MLPICIILEKLFLLTYMKYDLPPPHTRKRYPCFDVAVGLVWSNDPERYAGGSVATGRVSYARHVRGNDPDEMEYMIL